MSFLRKLLAGPPPNSLTADEERFWLGANGTLATAAGMPIGPEAAKKISAVWACTRLLAETMASLPAIMYQRLANDGRQRATNHPLYDVLHDQPNNSQTAFEFVEMLTGHALLRGNGYARIIPGQRGPVDQLIPIHPDRVQVERIPNGKLRYRITQPSGSPEVVNDEDMFHLRGPSDDGISGQSVITYARESLGLTLAAERFGARFFGNNARPGGILTKEGKLSKEAGERLKSEMEWLHGGANNHRIGIFEEGLKWQEVGVNQKDSQFLETREFQAEDVCRWFRIPPHMIGLTSKATSWGSGIEQMSMGFVIYTLMPWLIRWQQAISRDLILAPKIYFVEFLVDALLRGDLKSRYEAYQMGSTGGWLNANEIRQRENMNPRDGGDAYMTPMNMQPSGQAALPAPAAGDHYQHLVHESAARVVRKEVAALSKAARRAGDDDLAWVAAFEEFYADHAGFVAQTMRIPLQWAAAYVSRQTLALMGAGAPADWTTWEAERSDELAALALESQKVAHD